MPDAQQRASALTEINDRPAEAQLTSEAGGYRNGVAVPVVSCDDPPPVPETPEDQILRLAERCRQLEEQVRHLRKFESFGIVAGGIAHDFNNLLTGILGYAELIRVEVAGTPHLLESIDMIETAATQAAQLTNRLLLAARGGSSERVAVDVHQVLRQVIELVERSAGKTILVRSRLHNAPLEVLADPTEIFQVFLNLGWNARDAVARGGLIEFHTERVEQVAPSCDDGSLKPGAYALISVSDNGEGIPETIRERIFEPFFTTKTSGQGTGMGLAVVRRIVTAHGGTVALESAAGQGSRFFVYLPCANGAVQAAKNS